jgi:AraC family transcriptional activator of pobA
MVALHIPIRTVSEYCLVKIDGHLLKSEVGKVLRMTGTIPSYSLFGQRAGLVQPRFCHVERITDRWGLHRGTVEGHSHPHLHQLTFWIAGKGRYFADSLERSVGPETLCWMPSGTVHGFEVDPGSDAIVLSLSDDFAREMLIEFAGKSGFSALREHAICRLEHEQAAWIGSLFERMEQDYGDPASTLSQSIGALAKLVFIQLAQLVTGNAEPPRAVGKTASEPSLLVRFLAEVNNRLGERPRVAAIAADLGTTPYLLNRLCGDALAMRASEVIRQRHLQEAKRLLMFTALNIGEVGQLVGYPDAAHFTRTFKATEGVSPKVWRTKRISE